MFDPLVVKSSIRDYQVHFEEVNPSKLIQSKRYFGIVDSNVYNLYQRQIEDLGLFAFITVESNERSKDFDSLSSTITRLINSGIKRGDILLVIGGGVIQDIAGFIASILFRGVEWVFVPTTLLAQADSCIGSKTSINMAGMKNIVGGFYPPSKIFIDVRFLKTLSIRELYSGVGELVKVYVIGNDSNVDELSVLLPHIDGKISNLEEHIYRGLSIKRDYVEIDEFDQNERLIFNYGHSFGHSLEAATDYVIPHGLAVACGIVIANIVSELNGFVEPAATRTVNGVARNLVEGEKETVNKMSEDLFFNCLAADKKNKPGHYGLILPSGEHLSLSLFQLANDSQTRRLISSALQRIFS